MALWGTDPGEVRKGDARYRRIADTRRGVSGESGTFVAMSYPIWLAVGLKPSAPW